MQSPKASFTALLVILFVFIFSLQVSSIDTLKQGETLNSTSALVSGNGAFSLRFYTPQNSNNTYLALWFTGTSRASFPVWIANRQNPLPNNSNPILTLGPRGDLTVTHDGAAAPVVLYAGRPSQLDNVTATLLDTGNFVVNSSGPAGLFWSSSDRPTDTLLSGMKLGENRTLTSWTAENDPAPGEYSLEWERSSRNLVVKRRQAVIWRSGELEYYRGESGESRAQFGNIGIGRDIFNFNFNFTEEEEDVVFTALPFPGSSPRQEVSGWKLEYDGDIVNIDRSFFIARPAEAAVVGPGPPASPPGNAAAAAAAGGLRAWMGFAFVAAIYGFA